MLKRGLSAYRATESSSKKLVKEQFMETYKIKENSQAESEKLKADHSSCHKHVPTQRKNYMSIFEALDLR